MTEERKQKMEKFRIRVDKFSGRVEQMYEREQSVKPLDELQSVKTFDELRLKAEELDKNLRDKLNACFVHQV